MARSYPAFGCVKTIVIPYVEAIDGESVSLETFKEFTGIDLSNLIYFEESYINLKLDNTMILLRSKGSSNELNFTLPPNTIANQQYVSGSQDGVYTLGLEDTNGGVGFIFTLIAPKEKPLSIENIVFNNVAL